MLLTLRTKNNRKKFVESDVLDLGNDNASRFLEELFIAPTGIETVQNIGNAIVLTEEKDVQRSKSRLLIGAQVARFQTGVSLGSATHNLLIRRRRWQQGFVFLSWHCV